MNPRKKKISSFTVAELFQTQSMKIIRDIVKIGYEKTENKFSVHFIGSKGYLDNVTITCEGVQLESNNKIDFYGTKMDTQISIFHKEGEGVSVKLEQMETISKIDRQSKLSSGATIQSRKVFLDFFRGLK